MNILILGHTGKMGTALMKVLGETHNVVGLNSKDFDANNLETKFYYPPVDVVINCVAFMSIDRCEALKNRALRINTIFPALFARLSPIFVHFSSDAVFPDGGPFGESALVEPSNHYGWTKARADECIPLVNPKHYICRIPILFGETSKQDQFVEKMLARRGNLKIADDIVSSPTYSRDVARFVHWLIETKQPYGLYHVANEGIASLYDLMKEIIEVLGLDKKVSRASYKDFQYIGTKNTHTPLISTKLGSMRPWREAVREYCGR